jgi:hypothetical protein
MSLWCPIELADAMGVKDIDDCGDAIRVDLWARETMVRGDGSTVTTTGLRYLNAYWSRGGAWREGDKVDGEWKDENHNRIEGPVTGGWRNVTHFALIEPPEELA